jgi:hypothetical protein
LDLAGEKVVRLHHREYRIIRRGNARGGISARACGARISRRDDRSLLRRLLDGRVDVEGSSKPDDAQQEHKHQRQDHRSLGDLRPVGAAELTRNLF